MENDLNLLSDNINNSLDDTDNYLAAELLAIESHCTLNSLVELKVLYMDSVTTWHLIGLVINESPLPVYALNNDLGSYNNNKYGRWARKFQLKLKQTIQRL